MMETATRDSNTFKAPTNWAPQMGGSHKPRLECVWNFHEISNTQPQRQTLPNTDVWPDFMYKKLIKDNDFPLYIRAIAGHRYIQLDLSLLSLFTTSCR